MFPVDQGLTSVLEFAMHVAHFEYAAKIAKTGSAATMAKQKQRSQMQNTTSNLHALLLSTHLHPSST